MVSTAAGEAVAIRGRAAAAKELDGSESGATDHGGNAVPAAVPSGPNESVQDPLPDIDGTETADGVASGNAESGSGLPETSDRAGADAGFVAGHGLKAHISVTIDYDALKSAAANATGDLVFGDALSAATLRRLACDAEILPIVLGSKSQPLDVGTSQRLVTRPMRRALNARDKGCVVCGAPPVQCEAHHLKHWVDGGITAVSNLVLLCKRHHLDLHSGHWKIRIVDGVVHVTRPTWADPGRVPRGRYRPPLMPDQPRVDATFGTDVESVLPELGLPAAAANLHLSAVTSAGLDPWGDEDDSARRPRPAATAVPVIPWADDPPPTPRQAARNLSSAGNDPAFDPWAEDPLPDPGVTHRNPSGAVTGVSAVVDPWGDGAAADQARAAADQPALVVDAKAEAEVVEAASFSPWAADNHRAHAS
jgi:hypothetical protein